MLMKEFFIYLQTMCSVTRVDIEIHLLYFALIYLNVLIIVNCYNPITAFRDAPFTHDLLLHDYKS